MPRPEKVFKTEAIILRRYEFGEADRILTLLTPEHGKLRAIAKGARKITSKMSGHVELFCRIHGLLAQGGELYVLSQAEQLEPYLPLREDMRRLAHAHYIVELLDRFTEFEEASQPMFALLEAALHWLCADGVDLPLVARFFELRLLRLTGFEPSLFQCVVGEEDLSPRDQYFSVVEGGVVCPEHRAGHIVMPLSLTALKMLRYMATRDYDAVKRVHVDPPLHDELERILQSYLVHLLESRLKSAEFIHRLKG
jgi:DNA repair protein RecO (recombination protein O)